MDPTPEHTLSAYYAEVAGHYEELWRPLLAPMGAALVREMELDGARVVLDVATGTGGLLPALHARAPDAGVLGVDRAQGMLAIARARAPRDTFVVMDAQRLAVSAGTVDAVTIAFALFHMPEPMRALREAVRVLRSGGQLGLTTWAADVLPGTDIWNEELDACGAQPDPLPANVLQHDLVDREEKMERLLSDAGLAPERVWQAAFDQRWTVEALVATRVHCGCASRRLRSLSLEQRAACADRVGARLAELAERELHQAMKVVFGLARKPASNR